jgi:hypothetical protein
LDRALLLLLLLLNRAMLLLLLLNRAMLLLLLLDGCGRRTQNYRLKRLQSYP